MKRKPLILNTFMPLALQIVTIFSGFILPRLFIEIYGSEVNGLVSSVAQFISVISFLEMGVGSVIRFNLYKPIAEKDNEQLSRVISSAKKFYRRLAVILVVYVVALMIFYPLVTENAFDHFYTALLIASMSISTFAQYFFGQVNQLLLSADQKGYIHYAAQVLTVIANTTVCIALITAGKGIHAVKLATSVIYLLRPVFLWWYVKKNYSIDYNIKYNTEPIQQKWNGLVQHISAVVLDGTDVIILTAMSTLSNVSIYSVYHMIVRSIKSLLVEMTAGIQALMGKLFAENKMDELSDLFRWSEWIIHTGTVFVFGCTATLIIPFVQVYTLGINDIDYVQPLFGLLLTLANAGHCLRLPYNMMILAGGHYKQTQCNYIIATVVNIVISVVTVGCWGLIGVAIGTLVAMIYQTVWMAWYISRNLIKWPFVNFVRQIIVDVLTFVVAFYISRVISLGSVNYLSWLIQAVLVALIWIATILLMNILFCRSNINVLLKKLFINERPLRE